jgi:hypothetical protein
MPIFVPSRTISDSKRCCTARPGDLRRRHPVLPGAAQHNRHFRQPPTHTPCGSVGNASQSRRYVGTPLTGGDNVIADTACGAAAFPARAPDQAATRVVTAPWVDDGECWPTRNPRRYGSPTRRGSGSRLPAQPTLRRWADSARGSCDRCSSPQHRRAHTEVERPGSTAAAGRG